MVVCHHLRTSNGRFKHVINIVECDFHPGASKTLPDLLALCVIGCTLFLCASTKCFSEDAYMSYIIEFIRIMFTM